MGKGLATCCAIAVAIAFGLLGAARADAAISPVAHTTANTGFGTAGSLTVTKPAGTAAGDLLLLYVSTEGGTAIPIPAGWSTNYSTAAYYGYAIAAYKIAGASEPASYTVNLGTTRKATVALQAWRGVDNVNPLGDVATDGSPFSSTSAPAGSVTTTRVNSLVVVGVTWGDEVTSTTPAGVTSLGSVKTSSGSGGLTSHHGYFTQAAAGATPTRTYTSSISTDWGTASTVLQAPPATPTINSSPATPSNSRSPSWSFSVSEAGDTFQCQLNRGGTVISAWAACTSAKSYD
ncbi:MAG: hypothetical protein ACJ77M_13640, partial [Thermoleophilaceae bacterium]